MLPSLEMSSSQAIWIQALQAQEAFIMLQEELSSGIWYNGVKKESDLPVGCWQPY